MHCNTIVVLFALCRLANHEKSKKHKEKVALLKQFMEEEELQASVSKKAMDDSSDLANDITRSSPDEPKAQDFTTEHDQGNSSTGCAGCLDTSMAAVDLESIGSPCTVSRSGKVILSSEESESADEEVSFTMFRYV